jgi:hypothetical protein
VVSIPFIGADYPSASGTVPEMCAFTNASGPEMAVMTAFPGRILVASDSSVMAEGGRITLPPSTGAWISR